MRDFARPLIEKLPWIMRAAVGTPPDVFFGTQAVLRVAAGNALFFGGLAAALAGVESSADARHRCGCPCRVFDSCLVSEPLNCAGTCIGVRGR